MTAPASLNLAPGIYHDVTEEQYHADALCDRPTLSRSEAMVLVDESPLHLWSKHPRLHGANDKKVTKAMDFGSAAHSIILGKGAEIVLVEADDWRTKAAQAARDSIREQGKTPLLKGTMEEAEVVVTALKMRLHEFGLDEKFHAAQSETVLLWDENPNCTCRVMADKLLIDGVNGTADFFDVKFTDSATPKWLPKHFVEMGYGLQEAFYIRGLEKLMPQLGGRITFTFLLMETKFPFVMVPVQINGEFHVASANKGKRAVELWTECMTTGRWPGFTSNIITIEPPPWLIAQELGASAFQ